VHALILYCKALLYNSNLIIPKLHCDFNEFRKNPAPHVASNTRKATYLRQESTFALCIGTPPPLPSIAGLEFQQFHTSSRPRGYCQKTQLLDPGKDFRKGIARQPQSPGLNGGWRGAVFCGGGWMTRQKRSLPGHFSGVKCLKHLHYSN
jgi:hypothetical protein